MRKAIILLAFLLPVLTGCTLLDFFRKKDENPVISSEVVIDSEVYKECAKLSQALPKIDPKSADSIALENISLIGLYGECANRQKKGIEVIKLLSGKK